MPPSCERFPSSPGGISELRTHSGGPPSGFSGGPLPGLPGGPPPGFSGGPRPGPSEEFPLRLPGGPCPGPLGSVPPGGPPFPLSGPFPLPLPGPFWPDVASRNGIAKSTSEKRPLDSASRGGSSPAVAGVSVAEISYSSPTRVLLENPCGIQSISSARRFHLFHLVASELATRYDLRTYRRATLSTVPTPECFYCAKRA